MKRIHWILLIVLIAAAVFVIHLQNTAPYHHDKGQIFGTYYSITYQNDTDLHEEIMKALHEVDSSLSMFNKNSTISRINRGEDINVDKMLAYLFPRAQKISESTDGAFDITVAPLVNAWGFGFKENKWPTDQQIDSIKTFVGYEKVKLENGKIIKNDPRIMVDLSAIAKGYGSDMVAKVMNRAKVRNYMVEIGGEIVTKGKNEKGENWKIGIAKPTENEEEQGDYQCIMQLTDYAAATSGNYRKFFYKDGKKYAHTIDPKSGYPVQHDIISATVLAPACYEADAYATSFMVMGLEKAKAVIESNKDLEAYFIYVRDGKQQIWMSKGFGEHIVK